MQPEEAIRQLSLKRANDRADNAAKQVVELTEKVLQLEEMLEAVAAVKRSSRRTPPFTPVKVAKGARGECIAHMIGSDWHLEERVDPKTVSGLNRFELDIAAERVKRFFDRGLWLCNLTRKGLHLRGLVVALLGDLITGQHLEEQIENNQLSPVQAVDFAFDLCRAGLSMLKKEAKFQDPVTVVCCSGNHGRTVGKPRASTREKHSFEWLLYRILQRELADSRMHFEIADGYHLVRKEHGFDVRYHHGDAIRYQGGVGGLTIPAKKALHSWNRGRSAYLDVFGHYHQQFDGGNFMCNGSLIGYNAFAVQIKAEFESPQQTFFLLDRSRGKILTAPIFVEEE